MAADRPPCESPRAKAAPIPPLNTRTLLALAVPSAAFTLLTNGYRVVDQYFVQQISVEAQAAVGSSVFVLITFYAAFELLAAGAGPLIARATGAGDPEARKAILGEAVAAALLVAGLVMLVGALGAALIARSLGLSGLAASELVRYLQVLSLTALPLVLTPLVDQAFLSMGNARAPMLLHAISLALNVVLTPLLIHQAGLGIAGAALASNIARGVATGAGLWLLVRLTGVRIEHLRFTGQIRRILRIGTPMALSTALYAVVYWALIHTSVSPLGPHVNAALGIGFAAMEGFTWPVFHGVSLAVASLVGRYLGAGRKDLAKRTVRVALPITTGLGLLGSFGFFFGGPWMADVFADEPAVRVAAAEYALILAASQLFVAWEALSEGVLAGAGDTRTIFWWSTPFNLLRVPLAWAMAFPLDLGAAGIWWAINATSYAKVLGKGWATFRGRWAELEP